MDKKVLLLAAAIVLLGFLAWFGLRWESGVEMRISATATTARPFGPGWAADYGTADEDRNLDGLDVRIEELLRKKRP